LDDILVTDEDLKSFKIINNDKNGDSLSFKSDENIINERRICSEDDDDKSGTVFESQQSFDLSE
jgi:hypothetical protein